ncbi:MAG: glycosyltransferase [bacterium]|nr:glycosyltransferase [bacterium]
MNTNHFLTLVIPSYKQEKIIVKNLQQLLAALQQIRYDYEVVVVVDGEIDETAAKIKKANLPKVSVVTYPENQGKSYAIRQGMKKAKGDYVMFLDAGMEIDPNGISMLLEHMEWYDADIVVGSKRHPASKVNYPAKRKILSDGYYYLIRILFGLRIRDTQAGIKIFKKQVLDKILPRLVEKKFAGDLEMLVVARQCGFNNICEAPINLNYSDDQFSTAVKFNSVIGIFIDTLAIWYRKNILHYYNRAHIYEKN